jgi:hypothetical protein
MLLSSIAALAIVTQDQTALRAAPRDAAQQQAVLWQGESVEIRGEKADYIQVYDHRLERGGYIKASQLRSVSLEAADAPQLLSIVRFLRDTPGAESLGIAYAAAYLKAAPAADIKAEPFDALGSMADRLARKASVRQGKAEDPALSGHLDVVASYGVNLQSFERDGRIQLCYDGEAFRRVFALNGNEEQKARAALAMTRSECINPALPPAERDLIDKWRAEALERATLFNLPEYVKNRVHMRRAGVWSAIAFERARRGEAPQEAANRALDELAVVNKSELTDEDQASYSDAALRVGASRWAAEPVLPAGKGLHVATRAGQPGETCVMLLDAKHDEQNPITSRCTYGVVWTASASSNAQGNALALAVQPLDSWRELWVFHQTAGTWSIDVLPPAATDPNLGYIEFAGWVPGRAQMLTASEAKLDTRFKRSFANIKLDTMEVDKQADKPASLSTVYRWQDPSWKRVTVSLR